MDEGNGQVKTGDAVTVEGQPASVDRVAGSNVRVLYDGGQYEWVGVELVDHGSEG